MNKLFLIIFTLSLFQVSSLTAELTCSKLTKEVLTDYSEVEPLIDWIFSRGNVTAILENPRLHDYIKIKKINWDKLPIEMKRQVVSAYFFEHLKAIELAPQLIRKKRGEVLAKSLKQMGYDPKSSNGHQSLRQLSSRNLKRVLEQLNHPDWIHNQEAKNLTKSVTLLPVHNSHVLKSVGKEPIISSRQIEAILGTGGLNTHPFNKDFMQTDDQLFFFPHFINSASRDVPHSKYGRFKITLDEKFMMENGWVSPYVMYSRDLFSFGQSTGVYPRSMKIDDLPTFYNKIQNTTDWKQWLLARDELHQYTFTASDYDDLCRQVLTSWLSYLKKYEQTRYQKLKEELESSSRNLKKYVEEAFRIVLKVHFSFEFKVPYAIESEYLRRLE